MTDSIKRRTLLAGGGLCLLGSGWLAAGPASAAQAPAGPLHADAGDVAFLNRVTWGVDSAALAECHRLSRRDYLQAQLHPPAGARLPPAVQAQIDAFGLSRQPMPLRVAEMEQRRRDATAIADDEARKAALQARVSVVEFFNRLVLHSKFREDYYESHMVIKILIVSSS